VSRAGTSGITCGGFAASHASAGANTAPALHTRPESIIGGVTVLRVKKLRIDAALAERGLFPSRTAAAAAVRAGEVQIGADGPIALRPSEQIGPEAELIIAERPRFVSRGGFKLANALDALGLDVSGLECLDVGASTGGFTDCLLQRGTERVIALDVARGQLDAGLRDDPRVTVIERRNARELDPTELPFAPGLAVIDVSFISLTKVLPAVQGCLAAEGEILALVKPQFELGRGRVGRGGVVRSPAERREAIRGVAGFAGQLGLRVGGLASSGLPGPKGNLETFVWCGAELPAVPDFEAALAEVEP
jgi:23S rRNA (cytidine1920-2'-O)/16S rRNA (cytidine1409-2'-O)-methyltransferase